MGYASTAMMAAGSVAKASGSYSAARSQKDMLETEAGISDQQAAQAISAGETQAENASMQAGALQSHQRANLAANGITLDSGSALDILASSKYMAGRNVAAIKDNAARIAWGYSAQSAIDRGSAAGISPGFDAFTSLLGSASTVASNYYGFKNAQGRK